ncbi:MAG: FAD:protein FMN transferase [Elusimicrobiota bacterium]
MLMADRLSPTRLFKRDDSIVGKFTAMGCSCEVLMDTDDLALARKLLQIASQEAWRIEKKFSRYNEDNIVHQINTSEGHPVQVDEETAQLLDFADQCFSLSDGLFDITSGILRKAWTFDGKNQIPKEQEVSELLPLVGWKKVTWRRPIIQLAPGMEIDLGGIGKEYAVDRTLQLLRERSDIGLLVNFGGDIAVGGHKRNGLPWAVGIEDSNSTDQAVKTIYLKQGAVATSGDSKKYLFAHGKRYGHILDPLCGWPVEDAPRSVTVAANSCSEAGFLSTLGILNGRKAESLLKEADVQSWCYR